ncbi:Hypothetical protein I595_1029 [Croceitalea dokdonensis DOKDO 023]|uniref:Uncharacterized protein n=1 Tax=Croceitalea dokdonensis DOKDO 023 TaxID=1300341 RepID=A0A0P7A760_9FLAO|nr:hypothetical protein [Croceitalea dokdonensis]KPM32603.1 Hypothetical protein I595_1029 [Croceitalea dokdonensis DOKDO 023]
MIAKHIFLGTAAFFGFVFTYGQVGTNVTSASANTFNLPTAFLQNTALKKNGNLPNDLVGSPYLNENFLNATIIANDTSSYPARLRYNAYADEIEMKKDGEITALFKRPYLEAQIIGDRYRIIEFERNNKTVSGYAISLNESDGMQLYKRVSKIFVPGKEAVSSYKQSTPPTFNDDVSYYLTSPEIKVAKEIKLKKKDLLEHLGNEEKLKEFLKQSSNKLKSEKEAIELIEYANTLNNPNTP